MMTASLSNATAKVNAVNSFNQPSPYSNVMMAIAPCAASHLRVKVIPQGFTLILRTDRTLVLHGFEVPNEETDAADEDHTERTEHI